MDPVLDYLVQGLEQSFLMAYAVWWALVFGFLISAIVQAWVPRSRIEASLSGSGARPIAVATGLGAASSSCSYAAIAIGKSLFEKGASAASALAFQFASTNLVWELGLVLWVLIGWQFTLAEYVGGIVMIVIMTLLLRLFVSPQLEELARRHAQDADAGHQHHAAASAQLTWRQRVTRAESWSDVAHNFRGDWQMLYKEITMGFLLAGFIGLLGNGFFNALFIRHAAALPRTIENVILGPIVAVLSFVCSVGNVPLAAVLWSGGISFGGVIAFLFADLIVLPIIAAYRKYYGTPFALRITALMFVTMVIAALIINAVFGGLGLIPTGARPSRGDIFAAIHLDYKLALNILGVAIFAALFWLTARRGATDPVCGMKVDRAKATKKQFGGRTYYFCSNHCLHAFEADPDKHLSGNAPADHGHAAHAHLAEHEGIAMTERGRQLHATTDEQIGELIGLISGLGEAALRRPCPGREKLGDGTVGASARHTADNYQRIAGFVQTSDRMSRAHIPAQHGGHRIPRFLRAIGHAPVDHAEHNPGPGQHADHYSADTIDLGAVVEQLSASRATLGRVAELTDSQLDAIPPDGSFRFCDGQRTLEQVLAALLKHQGHQVDSIRSAVA